MRIQGKEGERMTTASRCWSQEPQGEEGKTEFHRQSGVRTLLPATVGHKEGPARDAGKDEGDRGPLCTLLGSLA